MKKVRRQLKPVGLLLTEKNQKFHDIKTECIRLISEVLVKCKNGWISFFLQN